MVPACRDRWNMQKVLRRRDLNSVLPQCAKPLCDPFATAVTKLNIDEYISQLKKDQQLHTVHFGKKCVIPAECYDLIRLNLHLLKVGVSMNAPLKDICLFQNILQVEGRQHGGEVIEFYQKFFIKNKQIDWNVIDGEIEKILKKPFKERVRTGEWVRPIAGGIVNRWES